MCVVLKTISQLEFFWQHPQSAPFHKRLNLLRKQNFSLRKLFKHLIPAIPGKNRHTKKVTHSPNRALLCGEQVSKLLKLGNDENSFLLPFPHWKHKNVYILINYIQGEREILNKFAFAWRETFKLKIHTRKIGFRSSRVLEGSGFRARVLLTTSIICISVNPKLNCRGSDSLATGRSNTL